MGRRGHAWRHEDPPRLTSGFGRGLRAAPADEAGRSEDHQRDEQPEPQAGAGAAGVLGPDELVAQYLRRAVSGLADDVAGGIGGPGDDGQGNSHSQCPDDANAHPAQNSTLRRLVFEAEATVRTACQSGKGRRRNSAHTTPPITMTSAPMASVAGQYQTGPRPAGNRSSPVAVELVPAVPRSQPGADGRVHVAFPDGETHERGATTVSAGTRRPLSATTGPRQSRTRYRSNEGVESVRCMPGS